MLETFDGTEKHFKDWYTKLRNFVQYNLHFELFLKKIMEMDNEPVYEVIRDLADNEKKDYPGVDLFWYDQQLYSVLVLLCKGDALNLTRSVEDDPAIRGSRAWYRLTRDVAGKSGRRLKKLSKKCHHPAPIVSYREAKQQLTAWEQDLTELSRMEKQDLSEVTKVDIICEMIPKDLLHDVLFKFDDKGSFEEIYRFVLSQVDARKDREPVRKQKGKDDMDIDELSRDAAAGNPTNPDQSEEPLLCPPCEGQDVPAGDLYSMKGGSKGGGRFEGYCGYCNIYGHKRADCRKLTADKAAGKVGKGEEKGKGGKGKNNWQSKGGSQWNPGKGGSKGSKGQWGKSGGKNNGGGVAYNIDGENWPTAAEAWGGGAWGAGDGSAWNGGRFFGCMIGDDDDDFLSDYEDVDLCPLDDSSSSDSDSQMSSVQPPRNQAPTKTSSTTPPKLFADLIKRNQENIQRPVQVEAPDFFEQIRRVSIEEESVKIIDPKKNKKSNKKSSMVLMTHYSPPYSSSISTRLSPSTKSTAHLEDLTPSSTSGISDGDRIDSVCKRVDFDEWEMATVEEIAKDDVLMTAPNSCVTSAPYEEMFDFEGLDRIEMDADDADEEDPGLGDSEDEEPETKQALTERLREERAVRAEQGRSLIDECGDRSQIGNVLSACAKHWAGGIPGVSLPDNLEGNTPVEGSNGDDHPLLMRQVIGGKNKMNKPQSNPMSRNPPARKKRPKGGGWKYNFVSGKFVRSDEKKTFEDFTIAELRETLEEQCQEGISDSESERSCMSFMESPPGLVNRHELQNTWIDHEDGVIHLFDEEEDEKPAELFNCSWRSEPEVWERTKWVKVDSVMDSGASAPVAPPSMLPNVAVVPSEGSRRGQRFTSASKHKLKNLGEQKIQACSEEGQDLEVLFQIADVSKPLVSVSSICERGNRVIFGRSGGVVKSIKTGHEIPFHRKNGIYVLSMWMADGPEDNKSMPFTRP